MAITKIQIKNFKSLVDITIEKPNPFTVFVGPNASGKSNIFEALEFYTYIYKYGFDEALRLFLGKESIVNLNNVGSEFKILMDFSNGSTYLKANSNLFIPEIFGFDPKQLIQIKMDPTEIPFFSEFSKIFINNIEKVRIPEKSDFKLSADAKNIEKVLKRVLQYPELREELIELLSFLVPDFKNLEIRSDELSGSDNLLIYEKHTNKPLPRHLISDGTFNIISLITSAFQSYIHSQFQRQFLCIEEPENGLHPEAIKELVYFFREQCEKKGHYIWLTTHSQSLVSVLKPEEIIVVDKIKGETKIKQFIGENFHGLKMDEAWLSNVLGGGLI
jgi:predicted ATPase